VIRIGARLDIKGGSLVKGVHLEGLRKLGLPSDFSARYSNDCVDEIFIQDVVASLYGIRQEAKEINKIATSCFVPVTVGGGVRSVEDAVEFIRAGADRIAVNTAAVGNPELLTSLGDALGKQAVVLSVEAKRFESDWEVLTDSGRNRHNLKIDTWLRSAIDAGIGEIHLTSIDKDGTMRGPDFELVKKARAVSNLPLIYQGGIRSALDVLELVNLGVQGVSIAAALHYRRLTVEECKNELESRGVEVRRCPQLR
jgi:cyclase